MYFKKGGSTSKIKKYQIGGTKVNQGSGYLVQVPGSSKLYTDQQKDSVVNSWLQKDKNLNTKSTTKKTVKLKKGGTVGGKTPMTPAQKKFAALAPPKNKITFADKIAGSKKRKK